ncbi:MAG: photosystem I reaction center subunit VIII [Cyanobacteria bacterium J06649_5]
MDTTYAASWLPLILIPMVCWLLPVISITALMFYIEGDAA